MPKDSSVKKSPTKTKHKRSNKKVQGGRFAQVTPDGEFKERWDIMFDRLVEFKRRHGHCLVPNRYKQDRPLGSWVSTQRRQYKILTSGTSQSTPMTPERASRLVSIGFVWATKDPRQVPWETRYGELVEFKRKTGHCLVPVGYKENPRLANWVSTQRHEKKLLRDGRQSKLTEERVKLLEEVGFVWEAQRGGYRRRSSRNTSTAMAAQGPVPTSLLGSGEHSKPTSSESECFSSANMTVKSLTEKGNEVSARGDRIRSRTVLFEDIEREVFLLRRREEQELMIARRIQCSLPLIQIFSKVLRLPEQDCNSPTIHSCTYQLLVILCCFPQHWKLTRSLSVN